MARPRASVAARERISVFSAIAIISLMNNVLRGVQTTTARTDLKKERNPEKFLLVGNPQ
jgi:hypothetical protein